MNYRTVGQRDTFWIIIDYIPAAFSPILRNAAICNILEYSLMKISDVIII